MKNKETLHFKVSGEFLTNFVRDLYIEGRKLNDVIEILQVCTAGDMTMEIAQGIILGKYKLVGENEFTLEPDDKDIKPYSKQIQEKDIKEIEAGWISPDGKIYGVETYFCYNDHSELAVEIINALDLKLEEEDELDDPMYILEELGWLKFTPTWVLMGSTDGLRVTKEQKEKLIEFVKFNDRLKVPYALQLGYNPDNLVSYAKLEMMEELMITKYIKNL